MSDNNDFTHEFVVYNSDNNNGTQGTGKFLLYDDNINALKVDSIDNIKIGGGSNGRVLATDGEGNLRWISAAAVSGGVSNYNDLNDLPDLSVYAQTDDLATVATSGSYNDLTNKPSLFGGSYADLTNKPSLFSGSYNDLTNKPTIPTVPTNVSAFTNDAGYLTSVTNITGNAGTVSNGVYTNGTYANPAWITSLAYSKLTDAPDLATVATTGSYADLTSKPNLATVATSGSYSDLTNRPSIFSGDYTDLANKPVLFDGAYLSLTGLPNLAAVATSGSYDDLSNKPSIPDLTGYATESWVTSQGYGSGAGVTSYNDLTNKPSIPTSLSDFGITAGSNGQVLTLNASLIPVWATPSGGGQTFDQDLNTTNDVTFNKVTVTDIAGIENNDGYRITNTYSDGTMYVGSNFTQVPVSILMGGAGPRNEWAFTPDGKLTLPEIGTGIGWTNTDTAPTPDSGFLYSSTISFDKTLGIVLTNNVAGTDITWVIGKDGKIKLPAGGDIVDSNGNSVLGGASGPTNEITNTDGQGSTYSVSVGTDGVVTMITSRGSLEFGALPEVGGTQHLHIMRPAGQEGATDLFFGDDYNYVKLPGLYGEGTQGVEIGSSYNSETPNVWRFETWGDLTAPGGITASGTIAGNGVTINNNDELRFDANGSSITEQRPGEGYDFYSTPTTAITGSGTGCLLNISFGAGDTAYQVNVNDGGTYTYNIGDQLKVTGDQLGGATPDNDLIVEVTQLYPGGEPFAVFGVNVVSGTPVSYEDGLHIRVNGTEWTFGNDYTLKLPGSIKFSDGTVQTTAATGGGNTGNVVFEGNALYVGGTGFLNLENDAGQAVIGTNGPDPLLVSINEGDVVWTFGTDGSLTAPYGKLGVASGEVFGIVADPDTAATIQSDNGAHIWNFDTSGSLTLPAGGDIKDSNGNSVLGGGSGASGFTKVAVLGQDDVFAIEAGNELALVAGDGIAITTNSSDGTITISAASNATPQYGYFTELSETSSSNSVNGGAVVMDSDGNSYVGYTYYDNNINNDVGGIMKISNTGEQQWAVNIASQNGDARNPEIASLELVDIDGTTSLIALGHYYNNDTSKDVAFIYYINPTNGSINESLGNAELLAPSGMKVKDGVAGFDGSNPYVVVVGETYEQTVTKTLTPLAGSTTDKLFVSWADFAASGVNTGESIYYVDGPNQYGVTMNAVGVSATTADSTEPAWAGISITVSVNEAGNYTVSRVNGWGYLVNSWSNPVTLTVPGADLGGVTGVNDMTFDFSNAVFNNDSANIQAAISNIQGTPVTGVYCPGWGGYDWSTQIGNALTFNYYLNNQAYIGRFGQSGGWTKNFGSGEYDRLHSVVVDGDLNTYAVGYAWNGSRGSLVAKYDYEGGQVWAVYIDPSDNTGNSLMSVDLLSDGNLITVDEDGVVTKLNSGNGDIIWQVKADTDPSWDGDFRGTATPDGDYIITNYEDDDYTQYVMRVSGSDGSSVWNKRITRTYGGDNGEVNADDDTQYIDCNATSLTIAGRSYPPNGDTVGLVYSFPINGENTNGTYGQFVISSESMNWTTKSTTSIAATVTNTDISVTPNETTPTSNASIISANITTMGGEPAVEPTVISWTNPNNNVWRIEDYNGGASVSYNGSDYDAKWFDISNHTSGNNDFRGAIIQYHAFTNNGTIIGTIHLSNDYPQQEATHTEHLSGNSDLQFVTLWDCNNERNGQLYFKMTDGNSNNLMVQWTAKIFYGSEYNY